MRPTTPITPLATASDASAVMAATASGAVALPKSPVKRQAPRNGAGSSGGARSAPRVIRMPLPMPLASGEEHGHGDEPLHVARQVVGEREDEEPGARARSSTAARVHMRPKRSMIWPLA